MVIPCIFEPGSEGSFLLRVFTENSILHPNRDVTSEVSADLNSVEDINHTSSGESESTVKLNQGEKVTIEHEYHYLLGLMTVCRCL